MTLPNYLSDVAQEMRRKSSSIRRDFATHRLSAGENREGLVAQFLEQHLPDRFGISSGMIIAKDGEFSNQADLVVVDSLNNSPLYGNSKNKLWPIESVYSLIEVKTNLSSTELKDSIKKGQKFKTMNRNYADVASSQKISDSLFVIWAFECPSLETLKTNVLNEFSTIPASQRPDFIIVPDKAVITSGSWLEISELGMHSSMHRALLIQKHGQDLSNLLPVARFMDLGANALMIWHVWFSSWLRQAGNRFANLSDYIPDGINYGKEF